MRVPKVIFSLDGIELSIPCNENDVMKDICQKYVNKIKKNINTLVFIYGGKQLNYNLKYKDLITSNESKEMKILVYSNENDEFICPKCDKKIKLNIEKIDDIILSINNIKETIDSAKSLLENVIKISSSNNSQLKEINMILNYLKEDFKKIKEKVIGLLNENKNIKINENIISQNKEFMNIKSKNKDNINNKRNINENNYIIAEINIKENDVNKDIRIINSYEEFIRRDTGDWSEDDNYKNEEEIK